MPTGLQVAEFLGKPDEDTIAHAEQQVDIVKAMAQAYTRGRGFTEGEPNEEIAAVIITATARLVTNPGQIVVDQTAGAMSQRLGVGFQGWNIAETMVLNRYRAMAR